MSIEFLRSDVLRTVHAQLIQTYGGLQGIRDDNAFESAVARPRQLHRYTGEIRIAAIAASLSWAILRNHPFMDGNKRVALAALVMSVQLNRHRMACSELEETAMIFNAAASRISEDEWTAWALHVVAPR